MPYKLLAYNHQGRPSINGLGGNAVKDRLKIELDLVLPQGAKLYEFEEGDKVLSYFNITSIENYHKEAFDGQDEYDYLFVRDRVIELIEQKAYSTCISTVSDPTSVTPTVGDRFFVGENPVGDFTNMQGAIAEWTATGWKFYDADRLGYSLCSPEEQEVAAKLAIGVPEDLEEDFDPKLVFDWREEDHRRSTQVRSQRMRKAEAFTSKEFPDLDGLILFELTAKVRNFPALGGDYSPNFINIYKDQAVYGSIESRKPVRNPQGKMGIMDEVYGRKTALYDFTSEGLINRPWQPKSMSMSNYCDRINEILVLGI